MDNKISVIMPVYNTREYLPRAIESIINQTYENWELILIDDGSTDDSYQICKKYSEIDNRIKTLHKDNGGQGCARNMAINYCCGNYVMFLDSDDWIDNDTMSFLLHKIEEYDADIVECGCRSVSSSGEVEKYVCKNTIKMNSKECIDHLLACDDAVGPGACSKLFRYDLIKNKRFPEIRAYEDFLYIYDVCVDINLYVHVYIPKWNYFHRENSTMTAGFNIKKVALIDAQIGICEILKEKGNEWQYYKAQKVLCSKQFYILNCLLQSKSIPNAKEEAAKIEKSILISYEEYMKNPHMGKNRLMLLIFRYTPRQVWTILLKKYF